MELKCPVCERVVSMNQSVIDCPHCGFEYPFIQYFCNKKSLDLWKTKIRNKRDRLRTDKIESLSKSGRFTLGSDTVSIIDSANSISILGEDSFEERENVIGYSRSERNYAILFKDGNIEVRGDNSYGQCDIETDKSAVSVLCAPNCTYIVTDDGRVEYFGAELDKSIKTWKNVIDLAAGSFHLLGLTRDGNVLIAGEMIEKNVLDKIAGWKNVKSICAATDCSIALFNDGKVSFAGRPNDPRGVVDHWEDIVSIHADSSYTVGLTSNGTINISGKCKSFLDMGRSSVAAWNNVMAVSCSKSGIAGIFDDGTIKIVGNYSGNIEKTCDNWKKHIKIT